MSSNLANRAVKLQAESGTQPADLEFARALVSGLTADEKSIPCRFLYDARGSELFEQITELDEYYPTRTETKILEDCAGEIREATPAGSLLVEFGSGSSTKTEILLSALDAIAGYVSIEISKAALDEATERLKSRFPNLVQVPIVGDFSHAVDLPDQFAGAPRLGFFPGSTIGNLRPEQAVGLLGNMKSVLGEKSRLIVGADLKKDSGILLAAYNDDDGVTAQFNLNVLARANRELHADFVIENFEHVATYDEALGRIDMFLVSRVDQTVRLLGHSIAFAAGERVHTEHSHKYTVAGFQKLAGQAGWESSRVWCDEAGLFSVHELAC
ncbi:MAG: L-histidine N(alpha)-methyltransferase [Alphaproteobacteria bacterium]|nr:L-histidine N(alpha)-methyltransferase [Alphaproteobacteria bacterium]